MAIESIGVSCEIIIEKDGKVLLGRRRNAFGAGSWAFPGGHLERGEKAQDCAVRELLEEVGIRPLDLRLIGIVNDLPTAQDRQYVRFVFVVGSFAGEIANNEPDKCEGWEWRSLESLPKPLFAGHIKPLKLYQAAGRTFFLEE